MSRIGKLPIVLPAGVEVKVNKNNSVVVKGPKGELTQQVNPVIKVTVEENSIVLERPTDQKPHKAFAWSLSFINQQHGCWCN